MPLNPAAAKAALLPPGFARFYADLAAQAMLAEVNLSPKPGLVDRFDSGAHRDMRIADFYRSISALRAELPAFILRGAASAQQPSQSVLPALRMIGLRCEAAMFTATKGVNTHKGSIFSLGLLCAALGRRAAKGQAIEAAALCRSAAAYAEGITERELRRNNSGRTAGERLFQQLGLSGARGQAEAGWPLALELALPHYRACLTAGQTEDCALLNALLALLAYNDDTNIAARGGAAGLHWLQNKARHLLAAGGVKNNAGFSALRRLNADCIRRNLSPGGSADLLIITWFLAHLPRGG